MRLRKADTLAREHGFKNATALHRWIDKTNACSKNTICRFKDGKVDVDMFRKRLYRTREILEGDNPPQVQRVWGESLVMDLVGARHGR